jgi:hypothetical protein
VAGRVCSNSVSGFGDIKETFTYYDEQALRFGYEASDGTPFFIKKAVNNWRVKSQGANSCQVDVRGEVESSRFPGLLLAPIFRRQMHELSVETGEELKFFVEQNEPHPRKLKQMG